MKNYRSKQQALTRDCQSVENKVKAEVYGTSEIGVNDERSDKKGRRCRIAVVVT